MKLTNKQLEIVVDILYEKISKPIIEKNEKLKKAYVIDETAIDIVSILDIISTENILDTMKKEFKERYPEYNSTWTFNAKDILKNIKAKQVENNIDKISVLSKRELEAQVILSSEKKLEDIILSITNKFNSIH